MPIRRPRDTTRRTTGRPGTADSIQSAMAHAARVSPAQPTSPAGLGLRAGATTTTTGTPAMGSGGVLRCPVCRHRVDDDGRDVPGVIAPGANGGRRHRGAARDPSAVPRRGRAAQAAGRQAGRGRRVRRRRGRAACSRRRSARPRELRPGRPRPRGGGRREPAAEGQLEDGRGRPRRAPRPRQRRPARPTARSRRARVIGRVPRAPGAARRPRPGRAPARQARRTRGCLVADRAAATRLRISPQATLPRHERRGGGEHEHVAARRAA